MKKILLAFLLFIISFSAKTQTRFNKTYYYSYPDSLNSTEVTGGIQELPDGYISALGVWNYFTGDGHTLILKTNKNGDTLFSKAYGKTGYEYRVQSLNRTFDGNFIIGGSNCSYATEICNFYIIKINPQGDTLWSKEFNSGLMKNIAHIAIPTSDSGYAIIGWTSAENTQSNIYLVKTDSVGKKLWEKQYGNTSYEDGFSIIETQGKEFLICGWRAAAGSENSDIIIIKTDSVGNQKWLKSHATSYYEDATCIINLSDSNYLVGGSQCIGPNPRDNAQAYLLKIDTSGNKIWEKSYGGVEDDGFFDIKKLPDGSIIGAGATNNTPDKDQAGLIMKFNSNGDSLWSRAYNHNWATDLFYNITLTSDNGFIMGGLAANFGISGTTETQDAWMVKVDSFGCDTPGCQSVAIKELSLKINELNAYPNPFNNGCKISYQFPNNISEGELIMYDIIGRKINEWIIKENTGTLLINGDKLNGGIYTAQLIANGRVISQKKLIVIK